MVFIIHLGFKWGVFKIKFSELYIHGYTDIVVLVVFTVFERSAEAYVVHISTGLESHPQLIPFVIWLEVINSGIKNRFGCEVPGVVGEGLGDCMAGGVVYVGVIGLGCGLYYKVVI
ncbi:ORF-5 [Porcine circovirus type 2-E]|uniref:ORF-5 n=1 Tax=Porcine circovirus type 2-E TaxID=85544 RepID=Q9YR07_PCV2|nr:ORF-5 [Porcine circovirus type 2-E]